MQKINIDEAYQRASKAIDSATTADNCWLAYINDPQEKQRQIVINASMTAINAQLDLLEQLGQKRRASIVCLNACHDKVIESIKNYLDEHGYAPSLRDLSDMLAKTQHRLLEILATLEKDGRIVIDRINDRAIPRGIRLTGK
jgi:hypothetical protein